MKHIFIYALPTSQGKDARILEISAVRASGFGPYVNKSQIEQTFEGVDYDDKKQLLTDLYGIIPSEPFVLISYNGEVTRALLRIENEKTGTEDKFQGRAWKDVNQIAWPLLVSGQVNSSSLEALSSHFGVAVSSNSDSADVVTALLQVYGFLIRRYKTALRGESFVREAGGETLESLRRIIGF